MNTARPRNALAVLAFNRNSAGPMADRRSPRGGARSPRTGSCCPDCGGETYGGDLVCLNTACDAN
jgi:hypothetical protein